MANKATIPEVLSLSPLSLACPYCNAEPGKDCATLSGGLAVLHLARTKAAAAKDTADKPKARRRESGRSTRRVESCEP